MNMPHKGDLRDFSLAKILIELNRDRATGTLSITTPGFSKTVYIRDGNVIFASSSVEDDRLGEMLVKAGKISLEQYDNSVELLRTTGKRQGAILVDLGYLTPKDLFWGVKYQVKEIICSLFLIEDGSYEFNENAIPQDEVITLRVSMNNLIYEGLNRTDNMTRIRRELPETGTTLKLNEDPAGFFRGIDLPASDRTILSLVDGNRSIHQVIEESRMKSFEVMKTLYVLWSTGFIVAGEASRAVREEEPDTAGPGREAVLGETEALRQRAEELYSTLNKTSPSELLQITERTSPEEIKRNYYRLAKEFHPDRVAQEADAGLRDKVSSIFDAVAKAYEIMKDEAKRFDYFQSRDKVRREEGDTQAVLMEEQLKRGIEEFKSGNYWGAAELFRLVTRTIPANARAWSYLSLALSKMSNRLKEAEESLLQAIKLEPFSSEHYANLGHLYLKAGLQKRAQHQFEKALRLDPEHAKARKGLEQIQQSP